MLMRLNAFGYGWIARLLLCACAGQLYGCQSIPTMVPDMALHKPHPVQLEGVDGPLSTSRSRAILARLEQSGAVTNIFEKHLALEAEIAGTPLVVGNKVEILVDGPTTYTAMFASIENAKDHINMETFIIEDDEIGQRFSELLIRKQMEGVQVNLVYDSVGSINTPRAFFKPLLDAGVNVLEFNPINPLYARKGWQVNMRDHRKLLIVDGEIAFIGGVNISSVYSSGSFGKARSSTEGTPWRDTHLLMKGPVVSEFQKLFMATWSAQSGNTLSPANYFPEPGNKGSEVVRAIGSSPDEPYSQIYVTLLSAINSAETLIFITNAYFVPDFQLLAALKEAAMRGVDVRLLLPGKTDSAMVFHASRSYYDELLSAGVKLYGRRNALLHAKTMTIDGVWSTVGSTNLDWRSFVHNQEINATILGQAFGAEMQKMFEHDLQHSRQITLEQWRKRPLNARLKEKAARLWARWL